MTALALVLFGAVGCTSTEPGSAISTGQVQPTGTASTVPTATSTVSLPPRPREIRLDAVDPCALISKAQSEQLKIDRSRSGVDDSDTYRDAKECTLNVLSRAPFYDYTILLVTTEGVDTWFTKKRNAEVDEVAVGGFGAARFHFTGAAGAKGFECTVAVDVAKGQQLQVGVLLASRGAFTQDQICQMSEEAAGMAVATLQTLG